LYNFGKSYRDVFDNAVEVSLVDLDNIKLVEKTITAQNKWIEKKRDDIATRMWNDYLVYIQKE
jgi:hypothetical protein